MLQLVIGLILFLGIHSISIVAEDFRDLMAAKSEIAWKAIYSLIAIAGFILVVRGYAEARLDPIVLYSPPAWIRTLASLLLLPVFILFFAPYLPGRIKSAAKHPQLVAAKLWAVAHLLANGTVADVVLFGAVLAWAVVDRISMKRRDPRPLPAAPESGVNDVLLVVVGLAAYGAFSFWLHAAWIGVAPFG